MPSTSEMELIYDGKCPLCDAYVRHLRIGRAVGELRLTDARQHPDTVAELAAKGIDINKTMALRLGGTVYVGADCLHLLAIMSTRSGWFNAINARVFSHRCAARLIYPLLVRGRKLLLRLLRVPDISAGQG